MDRVKAHEVATLTKPSYAPGYPEAAFDVRVLYQPLLNFKRNEGTVRDEISVVQFVFWAS